MFHNHLFEWTNIRPQLLLSTLDLRVAKDGLDKVKGIIVDFTELGTERS